MRGASSSTSVRSCRFRRRCRKWSAAAPSVRLRIRNTVLAAHSDTKSIIRPRYSMAQSGRMMAGSGTRQSIVQLGRQVGRKLEIEVAAMSRELPRPPVLFDSGLAGLAEEYQLLERGDAPDACSQTRGIGAPPIAERGQIGRDRRRFEVLLGEAQNGIIGWPRVAPRRGAQTGGARQPLEPVAECSQAAVDERLDALRDHADATSISEGCGEPPEHGPNAWAGWQQAGQLERNSAIAASSIVTLLFHGPILHSPILHNPILHSPILITRSFTVQRPVVHAVAQAALLSAKSRSGARCRHRPGR